MLGQQMLRAMDYIHKMNVVHRDIKAENFIFSAPEISSAVKMIDFGMACKFEHGQVLTELCGSPHYLAPELIGQKYNHIADVWAFGVLLYLLMYGHYPYDAKQPRDIMVKILTDPIQWQSSKAKLSKDCIGLLKKLLEHNPKKRLTAEEALNHPWMKLAQSLQEGEAISTETLRSAHKKVTATRKQVDVKVDKLRNEKLQKIEEDFTKGIRHGQRLGETPKEVYMNQPEFLRRDNKLTTAPSSQIKQRKMSLTKLIGGGKGEVITIAEDEEPGGTSGGGGPAALPKAPRQRAASMSVVPRRLSYIGNMSPQEEGDLKNTYARNSNPESVLPGVAETEQGAKTV
jgi:serine/threonine protein kinase